MRHGFFGGSFDPVHFGHLILAETVRSDYQLDRIFFIPAAIPPHKAFENLSPAVQRLEMVRLAIQNNPAFQILESEMTEKTSYTVDTVERILADPDLAGTHPVLIIGMDSLADLNTWKSPQQLLTTIEILVVKRPGVHIKQIDKDLISRVHWIETPLIGISSTAIRQRVLHGQSIRYWVPEPVRDYIENQGLYR